MRQTLPNCVPFAAGQFGFAAACVAQCENILAVELDTLDLSNGRLGELDEIAMREIVKAIGYVIESDCEPA